MCPCSSCRTPLIIHSPPSKTS
ncbi:hypothetical protein FMM80_00865 [Schaedlerella arabinosiphila]|uniref:Uncharacterized protein n=1 Tax=Schaedlerella arabinosiphila TaxID=2044587 RepID=A0A9X5H4K0_9FIRM|nr:hypothetical protein [Schaedlerella arabinosiphila]